jgi:hypothetical protein
MKQILGFKYHGQQSCSRISQQIAKYVRDNNAGSCQFDVQSSFATYQQNHCHGQDGKKQLIFQSSQSAGQGNRRVERSEYVYYPGNLNVFHSTF